VALSHEGGWGTHGADLGPPDVQWGAKSVTGSLLATGSDNDHNVYAKFRFPCHPVVFRAGKGLALLTGAKESEAREALQCRGRNYRSMRDALLTLVTTPLAERSSGSQRERRAWEVADVLSRVLSRATILQLEERILDTDDDEDNMEVEDRFRCHNSHCIVPLHERLAHSVTENTKLISSSGDGREILLVATRTIAAGEELTRDYTSAPALEDDTSEGALRLLLQFGLPPSAWPPATTGSSAEKH
jgi:SET domain